MTSADTATTADDTAREQRRAADVAAPDEQDVRLAVVLNGGVSLAVWISGVAMELHRLVQGSRRPREQRGDDAYAALLDLLRSRARIDVIAGTSAGGLNGGFLSLGLVHGCDLSGMRRLWAEQGDLGALLRDPREKDAPSLMRGGYFHDRLADAYRAIHRTRDGQPASPDETVDLFLTGTLWDGRRTSFADDMGRRIVEVDYDATFFFSSDPDVFDDSRGHTRGDLRQPEVAAELAVASRCTSSFPGAFEPFHVEVEQAAGDRWASTAGLASFSDSQYVVDGGVLRNKPIRPAMDAIYRQPAGQQVRRVLAYVVPDPGEVTASRGPVHEDPVPVAAEVLLGVMTRLRSTDSVADELGEIEERNDETRHRRRSRDRLAQALLDATGDLASAAFPGYVEVRNESAARNVSRLLLLSPTAGVGWSRRELTVALREHATTYGLPFVPSGTLETASTADPAEWRWGQSTLRRLGDLVLDVLKRAVWLAPLTEPERVKVVELRGRAHELLFEIERNRQALDDFWRDKGKDLPPRGTGIAATPAELTTLRETLVRIVPGWEGASEPEQQERRRGLHRQALQLATLLFEGTRALQTVAFLPSTAVDPSGAEQQRLSALVRLLLSSATTPEDVLVAMLRLEVVHVAFSGATTQPEQEVELVQVSSTSPDLLTGIQEHHFGAFYRASWRVNDWLRGRMDGSAQVVQMLLAPERLRQLGLRADEAYAALRMVAVGRDEHPELVRQWELEANDLRAELEPLNSTRALPRTFPRCAARIAARVQAGMLRDELDELATAVLAERDPLVASTRWARRAKEALASPQVELSVLLALLADSAAIGRQRVREELVDGTDTFARTVTHGAAAFTSMLTPLRRPRVVSASVAGIRGYAVLLWVLIGYLTTRSKVGPNVVSLVVGVGATLLALALVLPDVPLGLTMLGAVLLLAAVTASALSQRRELGRRLAVRASVVLALLLAALAASLWWDVSRVDGESWWRVLLDKLAPLAVVVAVVALGWFFGRAKPYAERRGGGGPLRE